MRLSILVCLVATSLGSACTVKGPLEPTDPHYVEPRNARLDVLVVERADQRSGIPGAAVYLSYGGIRRLAGVTSHMGVLDAIQVPADTLLQIDVEHVYYVGFGATIDSVGAGAHERHTFYLEEK